MGIPLWKPKQISEDKAKVTRQSTRPISRRPTSASVLNQDSTFHDFLSYRSTSPRSTSNLRYRHSNHIQGNSSSNNRNYRSTLQRPSHSRRTELDRRVALRMSEKEDLLDQLEITVSLLDQFLSARSALGSDAMSIPTFITQELPALLASAANTSPILPATDSSLPLNDLQGVVGRILQMPPYSTLLPQLESSIASAHRRIREQLAILGTSVDESLSETTVHPQGTSFMPFTNFEGTDSS
ncbi:hypothetical protein BDF14DRAFT_1883747 [Spinellus fusiger]|nr:hypothetical protein BDF14DRAFT_1883747 [Spinellus fusiger]